jgi:uncharacterized LabA/DUF88 family protein
MKFKMKETDSPPKRLALTPPLFLVYIDGYNLYKGINHEDPSDLLRLGWSNYQKLGERLVDLSFQHLSNRRTVKVKYFTAIVSKDSGTPGEIQRQQLWLEVLKDEARTLEVVPGLHRSYTATFDDRKEKMTDVNVALHAARDICEVKPAGFVLVSGDLDFMPIVECAATANIPVAVFFPQEHPLYALPPGVDYSSRVEITYLTRDILKECRLSDERWLEYLRLKVRDRKRFQPCLDYEIERQNTAAKPISRR